jgi:hypothetical protein
VETFEHGHHRRGSGRLPQSGQVDLGVVRDHGGDGESEHEAQPEQKSDCELLAAAGSGDVEPDDACECADEQHPARGAAQIAAQAGAERGESDRDGDEPHDLAEQLASVALDRMIVEDRAVVGGGSLHKDAMRWSDVGTPPERQGPDLGRAQWLDAPASSAQ